MLKVMIVDDAPTNRKILGQMVASLGYIPILAADGARGLALLEDNSDIAAVVSDCQMPNVSGSEMVRTIRKNGIRDLPVLLYSSYIGVKEVGSLLDDGATAFLRYPLSRENLKEYLDRYLSHAA